MTDPVHHMEHVRTLLDGLPGTVHTELMLDWPCKEQVSLVWWDTTVEQIERENLHHFDGLNFRVLADNVDTSEDGATGPVWQVLAAAIPALRAQAAALADARQELTRVRGALETWRHLQEYFAEMAAANPEEAPQWRHAAEMVRAVRIDTARADPEPGA